MTEVLGVSVEGTESHKYEAVRKYLRKTFDGFVNVYVGYDLSSLKEFLILDLRSLERNDEMFADFPQEFENFLLQIHSFQTDSKSEFVDRVTDLFLELVKAHYSVEDFEKRKRNLLSYENSLVEINRTLSYELLNNEVMSLWVPTVFVEHPAELRSLFVEGLHKLAQHISTDQRLSTVQTIRGDSWIVAKHPKLVENLGFTIKSQSHQDSASGVAEISRGKFLELYLEPKGE